MPLLRNGSIDATPWEHHTADSTVGPQQMVSLADYLQQPEAWLQLQGAWLVVAQPDDDLSELPDELLAQPHFGIAFPSFTDGRGYSHAKILRQIHNYQGELIATGDVRRDQIDFMAQVGIDSFECAEDIDVAHWQKALIELRVAEEA